MIASSSAGGSKAEITVGPDHFRFAPNSKHWLVRSAGPFCAGSGREDLFDHIVGTGKQRWRYRESQRFCGLQIDDEFIFGGCLDRKVSRPFPLENAVDITSSKPRCCKYVGSVRYQSTMIYPSARTVNRW
jgi:hypothetical protein